MIGNTFESELYTYRITQQFHSYLYAQQKLYLRTAKDMNNKGFTEAFFFFFQNSLKLEVTQMSTNNRMGKSIEV